jgi:hypothetical protein
MKRLLTLLLLLSVLLAAGVILAAPDSIDIFWWTVDGGGAELSGGSYELQGTTGQADAGMVSNGRFSLNGGYWNPRTSQATYTVYLPVVIKS